MKLKEKLAAHSTEQNNPSSPDYYQGFLAGFEKARELAVERMNKFTVEFTVITGLVLGEKTTHSSRTLLGDTLKSLGEEEVST